MNTITPPEPQRLRDGATDVIEPHRHADAIAHRDRQIPPGAERRRRGPASSFRDAADMRGKRRSSDELALATDDNLVRIEGSGARIPSATTYAQSRDKISHGERCVVLRSTTYDLCAMRAAVLV
jgi:hypothetical protein